MQLISTRDPSDIVTFSQAVLRGAAAGGGLYMPTQIPRLPDVDALLSMPLVERSEAICTAWLGEGFAGVCRDALTFPAPVVSLSDRLHVLELFHGPTLAFKDFGAHFMAQVLRRIRGEGRRITILTATSGDTGAAVAHAFHSVPGIDVAVLYPAGRISDLQERLFCGLGGNVTTYRVAGSFDDCQAMVKACFRDPALTGYLRLTSANSINFSRILAQCLYYFEGVAQVRERVGGAPPVICVPSGNFGNLTAGLFAQRLGLPVSGFIAATNANDVVPAFVEGAAYTPRPSVQTTSNAMDVGAPSNWERIQALFDRDDAIRTALRAGRADDEQTAAAMRRLHRTLGYVADPHTAVGAHVLDEQLGAEETGLLLSTAHPAKFQRTVEQTLSVPVPLPPALEAVRDGPVLSIDLPPEVDALKAALTRW